MKLTRRQLRRLIMEQLSVMDKPEGGSSDRQTQERQKAADMKKRLGTSQTTDMSPDNIRYFFLGLVDLFKEITVDPDSFDDGQYIDFRDIANTLEALESDPKIVKVIDMLSDPNFDASMIDYDAYKAAIKALKVIENDGFEFNRYRDGGTYLNQVIPTEYLDSVEQIIERGRESEKYGTSSRDSFVEIERAMKKFELPGQTSFRR